MIDLCECCHEPLEPDRDGCDPGLCWDCTEARDFEDEDDDPEEIAAVPEDDNIVTSDYLKFYEYGFAHKGPVVECREGERWAHAVMAYMDREKFWPNVWFLGERGDVNHVNMYEALLSEENQ